jgi:DNA repair protein RadA/Sms
MTMAKAKTSFVCNACGHSSPKWAGKCPGCSAWNSLQETAATPEPAGGPNRYAAWAGAAGTRVHLKDAKAGEFEREPTGMGEFDRVLGGGLVPGSVTLIGGDPGIGKSTLLLQVMAHFGKTASVLYATGEESSQQVRMRAERLDVADANIELLSEISLEKILNEVEACSPRVVVIDSIQTMYSASLTSAPGSVAQVRECAAQLTRLAKSSGISLVFIGHVTKDGDIAGPRVLEHMVDTVLHFEGEPGSPFRMIRAYKNRFGAVNEMGVFAMGEKGLEEVSNPSSMFLTTHEKPVAGSCVLATLEGNRPFLVEVQALVEDSVSPNPRRFAQGFDLNKLQMLLAVLNKHTGTIAFDKNVYLKVVGGVRLTEPAADLAALLAVHSSLNGRPLPAGLIVFGEVGLAGEIRPVTDPESRLREAAKLGFTQAILPAANKLKKPVDGIEVRYASRVDQALSFLRKVREAA